MDVSSDTHIATRASGDQLPLRYQFRALHSCECSSSPPSYSEKSSRISVMNPARPSYSGLMLVFISGMRCMQPLRKTLASSSSFKNTMPPLQSSKTARRLINLYKKSTPVLARKRGRAQKYNFAPPHSLTLVTPVDFFFRPLKAGVNVQ